MIHLKIDRRWPREGYTIGTFTVNGAKLGNTLEDTDRKLRKNDSLAQIQKIKKYGETAIPKGTYKVKLSRSSKFEGKIWAKKYKGLVPMICDVPGFSGVRIHPGNKPADTLGCPLVGLNTKIGQLTSSQATYYKLMDLYLLPAHERGEDIEIEIV